MARPKSIPTYRLHKKTGQAVVTLADGLGNRTDVLLGTHGTPASRTEYQRVLMEWEARGRRLETATASMTIAELALAYVDFCQTYYRGPDGTITHEVGNVILALRPLVFLFANLPAADFGPLRLKAVRQIMIAGYLHPEHGQQRPLCRNSINKTVGRIKRAFRWASSEELIVPQVYHGLQAMDGLRRGRSAAKESAPVRAVARTVVMDTVAILPPVLGDMVLLQLESGMRPGEVVAMRACDLEMGGKIWQYRPAQHKTLHWGYERIIPLGPRCQVIIRKYLTPNLAAFLFSPRASMDGFRAQQRQERKTPVQPSQRDRKKKHPKKRPGDRYFTATYGRAITAALERHNKGKPPEEQIPHWHPHQLRHLKAMEVRKEFGLDEARAVLGHHSPVIAEHYAILDMAKASDVAAKLG